MALLVTLAQNTWVPIAVIPLVVSDNGVTKTFGERGQEKMAHDKISKCKHFYLFIADAF